jgi:hypothetical protein
MGLLDSVIEAAKQQYQTTKRGFGLLASNPQQFAQEATARYFPTKEEEAQFAQAQATGGDYTQMPYYQKIMDLSQFQGSIKPKDMTKALEAASINAETMLGLPPGNTPMDRAKAMGFDTKAFHGTNREFTEFSNSMLGAKTGAKSAQKAHFFANNPELSNTYVNTSNVYKSSPPTYADLLKNKQAWKEFNDATDDAAKWDVLEKYGMNYSSGQVMPLMLRQGNVKVKDYQGIGYRDETYNDLIKAAKKGKKDSVVFKNTYDPGPHEGFNVQSDVYAVFDPKNIRSRFAAFDPARANESDLLAAGVPLGLLGTAQQTVNLPEKKKSKK